MRFCVCVIKPLIDVGSELFKPLIDVGSEVVEAFVDVGGELFKPLIDVRRVIVEAFVYSYKAFGHRFETKIHGALEPINL